MWCAVSAPPGQGRHRLQRRRQTLHTAAAHSAAFRAATCRSAISLSEHARTAQNLETLLHAYALAHAGDRDIRLVIAGGRAVLFRHLRPDRSPRPQDAVTFPVTCRTRSARLVPPRWASPQVFELRPARIGSAACGRSCAATFPACEVAGGCAAGAARGRRLPGLALLASQPNCARTCAAAAAQAALHLGAAAHCPRCIAAPSPARRRRTLQKVSIIGMSAIMIHNRRRNFAIPAKPKPKGSSSPNEFAATTGNLLPVVRRSCTGFHGQGVFNMDYGNLLKRA